MNTRFLPFVVLLASILGSSQSLQAGDSKELTYGFAIAGKSGQALDRYGNTIEFRCDVNPVPIAVLTNSKNQITNYYFTEKDAQPGCKLARRLTRKLDNGNNEMLTVVLSSSKSNSKDNKVEYLKLEGDSKNVYPSSQRRLTPEEQAEEDAKAKQNKRSTAPQRPKPVKLPGGAD